MADEEDGNDVEETGSPTESKDASQEEFQSQSSTIEGAAEETSDNVEDEATLNGNDVEKSNGEIGNGEEVSKEEDEKTVESEEKIERPSEDTRDASLEKTSTSASKLTDVDGEEQASMKKKMSEKQQVQKVRRLQCGRQFRQIIGKQELRKEELEKREGDLRQRLDMLECSMPAVMVWNVWQRMSQGGPIPNLHRLMEKQFRPPAAGEVCLPSTPSQHYDCRVREMEAERKEARRRLDEARDLWLEKEARLKERRDKLEEAKRIQEERKEKIERLTKEANELREALRKMDEEASAEEDQLLAGACESGECGDIRCRERWLRRTGSVDSIRAIDVECLARLRELAESELTMKKQIAELERREETYMRTLQHADEMWSKMEGDTADTLSGIQEQLDTKINANQQLASRICELEDQLEKLRTRMAICRSELTKYTSIGKIEALIGREDDFAETADRMVGIQPKVAGKDVGGEDDLAEVSDKEVLTKDVLEDKETLARIDVEDKEVSPDQITPTTGEPMEPEKVDKMQKYLSMLGSLEELYYDDDYGVCGPEYACNEDWPGTDEDFSATDIGSTPVISEKIFSVSGEDVEARASRETDETIPTAERIDERVESGEVDVQDSSKFDEDWIGEYEKPEDMYEQVGRPMESYEDVPMLGEDYEEAEEPKEVHEEAKQDDIPVDVEPDKDTVSVPLNKLRSWVDTVDSIRLVISKCSTCSSIKDDVQTLAEDIAAYAGVKAKEEITEITPELATIEARDEEVAEEKVTPDGEMMDEKEVIPELVTKVEDEGEAAPKEEAVAEEAAVTTEEIKEEPVSAISDEVTPEETTPEIAETELPGDVTDEETVLKTIERDTETDDETQIIVPVEKLPDEEEVPAIEKEAPAIEVKHEVEEARIDGEPPIDEDAERQKVEEIEMEKLVAIETEDMARDTAEEIVETAMEEEEEEEEEEKEEEEAEKEISKELEPEVIPESVEEPTEKIETVAIPSAEEISVDADTEEVAVPTKEISEVIEIKEEREEVEEIKEEELMEKEMPILEEPEIKDIKEVVEEVSEELEERESPPSIPEEKPEIKEERKIPIDPKIVAAPYLSVADIEKVEAPSEEEMPCVCKHVEETPPPPTLPAMKIVITQTEVVQTVVSTGTQTWTVHLSPMKVQGQRSMETDTRDPDISARRMRWRIRPKNRSSIQCSNVSSQTEKPLLVLRAVSHDTAPSEKQRLLSSILESLKSSQSNEEKELRSISYGQKHHGIAKCNCCKCGKGKVCQGAPIPMESSQHAKHPRTREIIQDAKPYCGTLKSGIKEKQQSSLLSTGSVSKSTKQVCDRGICTCASSALRSKLRASSKKIVRSEKRDQSCLAKLSKSKVRSLERKKEERHGMTTCRARYTKDEPAICNQRAKKATDSPSSCMCTKVEKTPSGQIRKWQICACGDSD